MPQNPGGSHRKPDGVPGELSLRGEGERESERAREEVDDEGNETGLY